MPPIIADIKEETQLSIFQSPFAFLATILALPAAHHVEVCKVSSGKAVRGFPQLKYNHLKTSFQGHR